MHATTRSRSPHDRGGPRPRRVDPIWAAYSVDNQDGATTRPFATRARSGAMLPSTRPTREAAASPLGRRDLLAGCSVGRRAGGVNAHAGAGHEHRLMAIVPAHHVRWLTARALDLEHLTTTSRITDVQAMHRDPITDRCGS